MIEKYEKYCKTELYYTKLGADNETDLEYRRDIVEAGIQRCLGACQFAELCGADENELTLIYTETFEKMEAMLYEG